VPAPVISGSETNDILFARRILAEMSKGPFVSKLRVTALAGAAALALAGTAFAATPRAAAITPAVASMLDILRDLSRPRGR